MPASREDLRTWTAPGTQDAAQATYRSIETALTRAPGLRGRSFETFLQGSYANATNIRGDSDVDIVTMLRDTYSVDLSRLPPAQVKSWHVRALPVSYKEWDFRRDVRTALQGHYGGGRVDAKNKCIRVRKTHGYVDADVVPSLQHRVYLEFTGSGNDRWIEGIKIYPVQGTPIVNFPKEHIRNGQAKNQRCQQRYKPTVRQIKRLRHRAEAEGRLSPSLAPGYLLECMVHNVGDHVFVADDEQRVRLVLAFLASADLAGFKSCDGVHTLFNSDPGGFAVPIAERIIAALRATLVA